MSLSFISIVVNSSGSLTSKIGKLKIAIEQDFVEGQVNALYSGRPSGWDLAGRQLCIE